MTTQLYSRLIASSLASGFIAVTFSASGQVVRELDCQNQITETTLATSSVTGEIHQECLDTPLDQISALNVQPELMLDWEFPKRLTIAASR